MSNLWRGVSSWFQRQLSTAGYYASRDVVQRGDIARIKEYLDAIRDTIQTGNGQHAYLTSNLLQLALSDEESRIRATIAAKTPENLLLRGGKVYSQCDEDGIIAAIFSNLDGQKTFVEIACGDGLENNTHFLLLQGWRGVWVDGSAEHITHIQSELGALSFRQLLVEKQFVDLEKIGPLITRYCEFLGERDIDFFSLDIDGNDVHILNRSLDYFRPRVICVEYNAKFPPPLALSMGYEPLHVWANDDYYGCSLMALVEAMRSRYTLLTCSMSGVNAFFVRDDLAHQFHIYPPEDLYQPARHHRLRELSGHPNTWKWLKAVLAES